MAPMRSFGLVSALMSASRSRWAANHSSVRSRGLGSELLELGRVEDGLLHLADVEGQVAVAGTVRLEQLAAQLREGVPVGAEQVEVAVRDAAVQVGVEVLDVLGFGRVDVARDVEVVVVLRVGDLGERHHARVAVDLDLLG